MSSPARWRQQASTDPRETDRTSTDSTETDSAAVEKIGEVARIVKPRLRGWLHAAMAPLATAGGIVLVALAPDGSARIAAAIYLAGYSVECMLKALILSAVPQAQEAELLGMFRGARAHDYEWLLHLYVEKGGARMPPSVVPHFARVNAWSTGMAYVPGTIAAHEVQAFLDAAIAIMT